MASPPAEKSAASPRTAIKRAVHCTHTSMDRAFSTPDTTVECDRCGHAEFGWIYVCTADHESDDSAFHVKTATERGIKDEDIHLSEWVVQAIKEGHYTEEQIKKIYAQKVKVWTSIVHGEDITSHIRKAMADQKGDTEKRAEMRAILSKLLSPRPFVVVCIFVVLTWLEEPSHSPATCVCVFTASPPGRRGPG
jgi:predicted DNA-binding protein